MDTPELSKLITGIVSDQKALDIVEIDVRGKSSYADYLIVASGTSDRHVESIAQNTMLTLKREHDMAALSNEGLREGQWALVDFGDIILHVFHQYQRDQYQLEELWKHAPQARIVDEAPSSAS